MNEAARVAALTLDAVERRYGRGETTVEVLDGATLELAPGQSVALIAPSGAAVVGKGVPPGSDGRFRLS